MIQSTDGRKIGQILLESGLVTERQLEEALELQRQEGGRICSHLVRLGHLKADVLLEFLRLQFGVAAVNLSHYRIPEDVIELIPAAMARQYHVVPVNVLDRHLALVMEDPKDAKTIEAVERHTGLTVEPLIGPQAVIDEALRRYYPEEKTLFAIHEKRIINLDDRSEQPAVFNIQEPPRGLTPLGWMKRLLFLGIKKRSREIHLEPREGDILVRYRVGAKLVNGETLPVTAGQGIAALLLDCSGQDARLLSAGPREGWVNVRIRNWDLKLVFSTFPVIHGERVIMKLIDESYLKRSLTDQGLDKGDADRISALLEKARGLFLIASPSGQHRNWTLYHLVDQVKSDRFNVITVEPFLLFPFPGVNQTLFSRHREGEQYEVFQAALRQEPDIVGLANLEDYRILECALDAAAGRLILATVPMASSLEALGWLTHARYNSMALAHILLGVLTLRIVPRLCQTCRRPLESHVEIVEGTREMRAEEMRFWESPGCEVCDGTGRAGHIGLFETLLLDDDLRDLVAARTPPRVVYEESQRRGMRTILEDGLVKASRGEVDVRDVLRVAPAPIIET